MRSKVRERLPAWQGDYATARTLDEESLAIRRELGDKPGIATLLNNLGIIALFRRDLADARRLYDESQALFRQLGDRYSLGQLLNNQALVASELHDYREAHAPPPGIPHDPPAVGGQGRPRAVAQHPGQRRSG